MTRTIEEVEAENTRLRATLAQSPMACAYCLLPADDWEKCRHGFPGCSRSDDAAGCPELGARMELHEMQKAIEAKKVCHVCGDKTDLACSNCAINFLATVHVCSKSSCRDEHERKCYGDKPR